VAYRYATYYIIKVRKFQHKNKQKGMYGAVLYNFVYRQNLKKGVMAYRRNADLCNFVYRQNLKYSVIIEN
jgi:hypothetical protein